MRYFLVMAALCLLSVSCSSSDDDEVYDELLSNTRWGQTYYVPASGRIEGEGSITDEYREILSRLQSETQIEQKTDTINKKTGKTGKYLLSFGADENCQLEHTCITETTYQLETYEVEVTHYPNQTYREDLGNGTTGEIIVYNDSITIRTLYYGELVLENKNILGQNNTVRLKGNTLDVSDTKVEKTEEVETILMTYKRYGHQIRLLGEKTLTGTINEDATKIQLDEIGPLGRQWD